MTCKKISRVSCPLARASTAFGRSPFVNLSRTALSFRPGTSVAGRVHKLCLVVLVSLCGFPNVALGVDILNRLQTSRGASLSREEGRIVVQTSRRATLSFPHADDLPPKGSIVTFSFTMKSEERSQVAVRYATKLKHSDYSFPVQRIRLRDKQQTFSFACEWNFAMEDCLRPPSFSITLWEPGTYTISSAEYTHYKNERDKTRIEPLVGSIPLGDPNIAFRGTRYVHKYPTHIAVDRFRESYYSMPGSTLRFSPQNARQTSGIMLALYTESPTVTLAWGTEPQFSAGKLDFAVLLDGKMTEATYGAVLEDRTKHFAFTFDTGAKKGKPVLCEVTYPSFGNPYLVGIKLEPGYNLLPVPKDDKRIYVALGDSISFGTGQGVATYRTWPWQFAQLNHMELFNLAVGGGKVSVKAGEMLADWPRIDLITILIGANDRGSGGTAERYYDEYMRLIQAIRKNHPVTEIICISPTYSKFGSTPSDKSGLTMEPFREAVVRLVKETQKAGDKHIRLVRGEELSSENTGNLHFTPEGAKIFAEAMCAEVEKRGILGIDRIQTERVKRRDR